MHNKTAMEREVFKIAEFHALIQAKHLGSILLLIYLVVTFLLSINSYPSFYIFIAHNLFPLILHQIMNPKHKVETYLLPFLAKKYRYSLVRYQSNSMSFLCTCLFLFLWQQRMFRQPIDIALLFFAPTIILFLIVVLRIGGIIYYRKKLDKMLTYGK